MPSRHLGSTVAGLLLILAAAAPLTADPLEVRGWVEVEGETPPDARVVLTPSLPRHRDDLLLLDGASRPQPVAETRVAAAGSFAVAAPAPGMWHLDLEAPGRVPLRRHLEPLLGPVDLQPVQPPPDAGLTVRVRDADGAPVAGARVWVADHEPAPWRDWRQRGWSPAPRLAFSDEEGVARLPVIAGERPVVRAWAAGSGPSAPREAEGDRLTVTLQPAVRRAVVVRDPEGRPLPDVVLHSDGVAVARTDRDGRAKVDVAAGGAREERVSVGLDGGPGRFVARPLPPRDEAEGEAAAVPLVLSPATVLTGNVTDLLDGTPVDGAFVWPGGRAGAHVVTGADGSFTLGLPARAEEVHAAAVGYQEGVEKLDDLEPAESPALALAPAAPLAGRVVDGGGAPMAGSRLRVWPASSSTWRWMEVPSRWTATSGPDGGFHLGGLEAGAFYRLRADMPGYAPVEQTVRPGQVDLELVLRLGSTLTGVVAGPDGEPRAGVRVALVGPLADDEASAGRQSWRVAGREATSDEDGSFRVRHLRHGVYDVTAVADGLAPRRIPGIELTGHPEVMDLGTLRLEAGVDLAGVVVDEDGDPLPDVEVRLRRGAAIPRRAEEAATGRVVPVMATTDEDGRFRFTGFNEGDPYRLVTRHPRRVKQERSGMVLEHETLRLELPLAASLEGSVVDASGEPVGRALVSVEVQAGDGSGNLFHTMTRSDEGGAWSVAGVRPGVASVAAHARGRGSAHRTGLRLVAGERFGPLRMELARPAVVEGRVLAADGSPLPGVVVYALSEELRLQAGDDTSDAEGRFRLDDLPPGRLTVQVLPSVGEALAPVEVQVESGDSAWVELRAARDVLRGRVVDDRGRPVRDAWLRVEWRGRGGLSSSSGGIRSGPDGRFAVPDPRPGRYEITARFADLVGRTEVDVAPGPPLELPPELQVRLREPADGVLTGEILGVAPERLAQVEVRAFPDGGGSGIDGQVHHDGRYRVAGLRSGRWNVEATLEAEGRRAMATIELAPGEREVERDLDLDPPGSSRLVGRVLVDGEPFDRGYVWLRPAVPGARRGSAHGELSHSGTFRITAPAETYDLLLSVSGLVTPDPLRRVQLTGVETEVTLDLTTVAVQGRVVDGAGRPVAGARVALGIFGRGGVGQRQPATTGADGGFRIDRVVPGSYLVAAWRSGDGPIRDDFVPLEVGPGGVGGLELRLAR